MPSASQRLKEPETKTETHTEARHNASLPRKNITVNKLVRKNSRMHALQVVLNFIFLKNKETNLFFVFLKKTIISEIPSFAYGLMNILSSRLEF